MAKPFIQRKLHQIGKHANLHLINANDSGELFTEINKLINSDERTLSQNDKLLRFILENCKDSYAQLKQDLVILFLTRLKVGGFFIEFGATDGIHLSNTYLLESRYKWNGIVAEPARIWHKDLLNNRKCSINLDCVYNQTGTELEFKEAPIGDLSTISDFSKVDGHNRDNSITYKVQSISLNDLLSQYGAPKKIDYLSIDTEGSEYQILKAFNFSEYEFNYITIEHNYTSEREKIYTLLTQNGYRRIFASFSQWDDWYEKVRPE